VKISELYHATAPTRLSDILDRGLTDRGESKFQGNVGQRGVSTTHDFSVVSGGNFGNLILVLDGTKLSNYELVPTDYWGDDSEKEIRVVSKQEGETIIPPEAIKKLVFISPEMRRFEIKHLRQHGIPIESFWKGNTTTYDEDGRAIKENRTMQGLMENWRRFVNEGIDSRIQKQINNLKKYPNIVVMVSDGGFGYQISYAQLDSDGNPKELLDPPDGAEDGPWGMVDIAETSESDGECLDGFYVMGSKASKGWGPLLYDVALEFASTEGGGLMADRFSVSAAAQAVWAKYLQRSDVSARQMDVNHDPSGSGARLNTTVKQLTPDQKQDDCDQARAISSKGDDWHKDPTSKVYRKDSEEVIKALEAAGKLLLNMGVNEGRDFQKDSSYVKDHAANKEELIGDGGQENSPPYSKKPIKKRSKSAPPA